MHAHCTALFSLAAMLANSPVSSYFASWLDIHNSQTSRQCILNNQDTCAIVFGKMHFAVLSCGSIYCCFFLESSNKELHPQFMLCAFIMHESHVLPETIIMFLITIYLKEETMDLIWRTSCSTTTPASPGSRSARWMRQEVSMLLRCWMTSPSSVSSTAGHFERIFLLIKLKLVKILWWAMQYEKVSSFNSHEYICVIKKAFDLVTAVVTSPGYIYIYLNLIEFLISLPGTDKEYFTLYEKRSFKKMEKYSIFFLIYRYEF